MTVFLGYILFQGQGMACYRRYPLDRIQGNRSVPFWFSIAILHSLLPHTNSRKEGRRKTQNVVDGFPGSKQWIACQIQPPERNKEIPLFDLQTVGSWILKNATSIARLSKNPKNSLGGTRKSLILRHVNLPKSYHLGFFDSLSRYPLPSFKHSFSFKFHLLMTESAVFLNPFSLRAMAL